MASYNKVILLGNLTRDPEVRFTPSGTAVCHAGLAVNRRFKTQEGDWREETTFVDFTIWGKRGEAFSKFHSKGQPAFIEGELRLDSWEDKNDGSKRSKLYVVAQNWEFVNGTREGGRGGGGAGGGEESWGGPRGAEAEFPSESVSDTPF